MSLQMAGQYTLGEQIDKGEAESDCHLPPPLWADGILWADENHVQQVIGGSGHASSFSNRQTRISVDRNTGGLLSVNAGGLLTVKKIKVVPKYAKETRACYAVCAPTINGERCPQMAKPWSYTERKLVSYKVWKQKVKEELVKKRNSTHYAWKNYNGDNPYEEKFGLTWESELRKSTALKPMRSVHRMIDHLIDEGNRIFANTNRAETWMLYHDNLSIFWEKETVEYLKSKNCPLPNHPERTYFDRIIKIVGENNNKVHKRYQNRLPGDSPELMPLDNHLFADIREALGGNIGMTYWMDDDNPLKYSAATPDKIYRSICRTIESGAPTDERIIQDIDRIKDGTLKRIIDAKGTYIEDSSSNRKSRHGVRLAREQEEKKKAIKTDPAVEKAMEDMFQRLREGKVQVPCKFEEVGAVAEEAEEVHFLGGDFISVHVAEDAYDTAEPKGEGNDGDDGDEVGDADEAGSRD